MLVTPPAATALGPIAALPARLPRPLRFAFTGSAAAATQLALLHSLAPAGLPPVVANAISFLAAAQLNFALSCVLTWWDRFSAAPRVVAARWAAFHLSIAATALLNLTIFALAITVVPPLIAATAGIGVAAVANFASGDRFVFKSGRNASVTVA